MEAITDPDGITTTALLNCLRREVAEPGPGGTIRLPRTDVLLRAREGRWLTEPELFSGSWQPVSWQELDGDEVHGASASRPKAPALRS